MLGETLGFDLTELPELGSLYQPEGPLWEAQLKAAEFAGAEAAYFLVNGVTGGLQAAFLACCRPGEEVLISRHAHQAVWGALVLSGARPIYLPPTAHPQHDFPLGITIETLAEALAEHPAAKVLFLVHPTYEGIAGEIETLVAAAHARGLFVIADEAHGAHFPLSSAFPPPALAAGADLSVQGYHKSLGSLTQSAVLAAGAGFPLERLREALLLLQTTSPSFLLLASLDGARAEAVTCGKELASRALALAFTLREEIQKIPTLECLGEELKTLPGVSGYDPLKLILGVSPLGLSGTQTAAILREQFRVQVEMAGRSYILLFVSWGNTHADARAALAALQKLAENAPRKRKIKSGKVSFFPPEVVLTPREAFFAPTRVVARNLAVGELAGELVVPYPPGIPLVCPGERIGPELMETLGLLKEEGVKFQGLNDPTLATLRVLAL